MASHFSAADWKSTFIGWIVSGVSTWGFTFTSGFKGIWALGPTRQLGLHLG